jgi:hypothetical protein
MRTTTSVTAPVSREYGGCRLAARHASYWHAVPHDFASQTLCGLRLDGSGLSESNTTNEMTMHPACAAAYAGSL